MFAPGGRHHDDKGPHQPAWLLLPAPSQRWGWPDHWLALTSKVVFVWLRISSLQVPTIKGLARGSSPPMICTTRSSEISGSRWPGPSTWTVSWGRGSTPWSGDPTTRLWRSWRCWGSLVIPWRRPSLALSTWLLFRCWRCRYEYNTRDNCGSSCRHQGRVLEF